MSAGAIELLYRVVACRSVSGDEDAVAALLSDAMRAAGATAYVDEVGNAVGVWGDGPLQVTFLGHIDTVPGDIPVRVEDGKLYGRGTVDAKGSLCAAVTAASRLGHDTLSRLTLRVVGAVEEEVHSSLGARHAVATLPRPDLVIIGEPSGWDRYTLGYKGRLALRLESCRPKAHGARDEASAAELLLDAYQAVRGWVRSDNDGVEKTFDLLQVTLSDLSSSDDGLVERCEATVGFRLPPRWSAQALNAAVHDLVAARFPNDDADRPGAAPAGRVATTQLSSEEPYRAENTTDLARAFRVAIRAGGGSPRPTLKTGTSDMNVVAPSWPAPMLAYGPGDAGLDHTPNEHLPVGEYLRSIDVLVAALDEIGR